MATSKWHISPGKGVAACEAGVKPCPFGGEHFALKKDAIAFEKATRMDDYFGDGSLVYVECKSCHTREPARLFHDRSREECNGCSVFNEMKQNTTSRSTAVLRNLRKKRDQALVKSLKNPEQQQEKLIRLADQIAQEEARLQEEGPVVLHFSRERFLEWRYSETDNFCIYCKATDENLYKANYVNMMTGVAAEKLGVDRVKNDGPYELGNMAVCCFGCNQIKSNIRTHEEMEQLAPMLEGLTRDRIAIYEKNHGTAPKRRPVA